MYQNAPGFHPGSRVMTSAQTRGLRAVLSFVVLPPATFCPRQPFVRAQRITPPNILTHRWIVTPFAAAARAKTGEDKQAVARAKAWEVVAADAAKTKEEEAAAAVAAAAATAAEEATGVAAVAAAV